MEKCVFFLTLTHFYVLFPQVLCFVDINSLLTFIWFNNVCTTDKGFNHMRNIFSKMLALAGTALLLVACETGEKDVQEVNVSTKPIPGSAEDFKTNVKDRVFFALGKSKISAAESAAVKAQSAWLKAYPQTSVTVEGHCDPRGSRAYNLGLGNHRAVAVKNALTKGGVEKTRIKTISYGKDKPVVEGAAGEALWAQQRVAVTVVN